MTYLDYLEQKVLLERLVIGLEEPVLIKGLGELSAKIDSGNGGYNVIHGTDFHQQGEELMFTTNDGSGNEKKIQAKIIDTIDVNMGGGNIEKRPVIELDIKFAGEDYKKIPFSVSDRSTNSNPILISKGFVENELEALIDVGAMNISHEGIDVLYGESSLDTVKAGLKSAGEGALKGATNTGKGLLNIGKNALDGAKGIWNGIKNADKWIKGGDNVNLFQPVVPGVKNLAKVGAGVFTLNNILSLSASAIGLYALWHGVKGALEFKRTQNMASNIANGNTIVTDDYNTISKRLAGLTLQNTLVKDKEIDLSSNIIKQWSEKSIDPTKMPLCLVTSFMMTKGSIQNDKTISGLETEKSAWKDLINAAKEATKATKDEKSTKSKQGNTQEQEEIIESIMIFENAQSLLKEADVVPATSGSVTTDTSGNGTPTPTVTANASSTAIPSAQPVAQPAETSGEDKAKKEAIENGSDKVDELKQITTQFEQLNTFTLWFISIENDKKKKEQIENKIKTISETLKKLENGQQSANSTKDSSKPNSGDKTVVRDSFNPFRKKEAKEEQQTPESLKQNIEQLKKELNSISLPDKSSTEQELQNFFQEASIDNTLISLFKSGSVEPNSVSNTVSNLVDFLEKNNKQGFFCLAWTPQSQTELKDDMKEVKRQYYFFEKPNFIAYAKPSKVKEEEEWITSKLNLFKSQGII